MDLSDSQVEVMYEILFKQTLNKTKQKIADRLVKNTKMVTKKNNTYKITKLGLKTLYIYQRI